ncbi:MAG: HAMP domain-containing sensor histidine kinase [Chromatiales bacterium]
MRITHPFTFSSLLLGGFLLAAIPLLGGIYNMSYQLDRMSLEGHRSVQITEEVTLKSRQLAEAALSLQRAAGQYYVLEDPSLIGRLKKSHQRFLVSATALQAMPLDRKLTELLDALSAQESALFDRLKSRRLTGADGFKAFKTDFEHLHAAVSEIADQLGMLIQRQQAVLSKTAERIQQTMIWQSTAVICLSLLLAGVLSWLLSRPVKQLSESIQRLGDDDLETPVHVSGPRDISLLGNQLDWLRQRLAELEEQKLRFFRQVSHELKTPLTALWEAVDLLSNRVAGNLNNQQEEIVGIMCSSVRVLRQRIEELLQYQHALYQTKNRVTSSVSLESLIDKVMENLNILMKAKHLTLLSKLNGVNLQTDREQMEVVLNNLISNAIRFSPDGSCIEVKAQRLANETRISVCDQGPGIPFEDRAYIFQPFYQGENQPTGPIRGSGLGLSIARAHIEAHGGELQLDDDETTGTCFLITLPINQETLSNAS